MRATILKLEHALLIAARNGTLRSMVPGLSKTIKIWPFQARGHSRISFFSWKFHFRFHKNLVFSTIPISSCPLCGEGEQRARRRCQCASLSDISYFDVDLCGLENDEIIKEKNFEAWTSKPCLDLPCCAGLTEWSSWESCDTACFDHEVSGLTK